MSLFGNNGHFLIKWHELPVPRLVVMGTVYCTLLYRVPLIDQSEHKNWTVVERDQRMTMYGEKSEKPLSSLLVYSGAPNENIVQNHLNIALLNVF